MDARARWSKRLAVTAAGVLVALGFPGASTPSRNADPEYVIELTTAGPGTVTITPAEGAPNATCQTNGQEYQTAQEACIHHFTAPTRVTLEAVADKGRTFKGWSDFGCRSTSTRCTLNVGAGTRYVSAWFSPVSVRLFINETPPDDHPFGLISITPKPSKPCSLNDREPCEFPRGTWITLKREYAAPGYFWIGACLGNTDGKLDSNTCQLRLTNDEAVGAGYKERDEIPPPLGSGIVVVVAGRGKVTGSVVNGTQTLNCGNRCVISGLYKYDYVRLTATKLPGSRFYRWSNLSTARTQTVPMSSTNRIQAVFVKN